MATIKGWTDAGRVTMGSRPSGIQAGDVYDSGYKVQVFAANGYWTPPVDMPEWTFGTLDDARLAAQAHDQDVLGGRKPRYERNLTPRITSEKYRISRRVATYSSPMCCEVVREAWGWVDLSSSAVNAATFQLAGTDRDFSRIPAESDI